MLLSILRDRGGHVRIFRVLTLVKCNKPPEVTVLGIEPAGIGWSMKLSPPVTKALPALMQTIREEIGNMRSDFSH